MKKENIEVLSEIYRKSDLKKGSKGPVEYFTTRLKIAVREETMVAVVNRLMTLLDYDKSKMAKTTIGAFLECKDRDTDLSTVRAYADLVGIVCSFYEEADRENAAAQIPHIENDSAGYVLPRVNFDLPLECTLLTPLAHGADEKSGNTNLFAREDVITDSAGHLFLPRFSGNALRGLIRRKMAVHFTRQMGLEWNNTNPVWKLWFYYVLTSGGSIGEKDKEDRKTEELIGKGGVVNTDGIRQLRAMLPGWSALGGCIGQKALEGRVIVNALRPRCREWGNGTIPANSLFEMDFAIRHDDLENPEEYNGMIVNTEMLAAGNVLEGGIDYKDIITTMERSAFETGLLCLMESGYLGARNSDGFGKVRWTDSDGLFERLRESRKVYETFLRDNKEEILQFLIDLNALEEPKIELQ